MLDINYIRNNINQVEENSKAKGVDFDKERFLNLDQKRKELLQSTEMLQAQKNKLAKKTGAAKRNGEDMAKHQEESKQISEGLKGQIDQLKTVKENFEDFCLNIPNIFHNSVPIGLSEKDNIFVRAFKEKPKFDFDPKPHWDVMGKKGSFDFKRAGKISGSRFCVYLGSYAKLERVLINFMVEFHTKTNNYTEVLPPFMVNAQSLVGTGNLPKFEEDLYKIKNHDLYLIPTAEVPLTNLHSNEILDPDLLTIKYTAYTPCFRSEAGSYGKDIRGVIRQHQFNKVELLKFTLPEDSFAELETLTLDAESILKALGLHYRVNLLCSSDMSFSSAKTYDIEVWMPARNDYVEVSSCSNFGDFQARRAKIRFKSKDKKRVGFVHTINGSGLAIGRTVAAILENYQQKDGRVKIPEVLAEFFKGENLF